VWIPHVIDELIKTSEQLKFSNASCILSEDGGVILDNNQKLYLIFQTKTQ